MDAAEFRAAKQFIFNDTEREIELARASEPAIRAAGVRPGGGNFLAALELLCDTEFGGRLKYNRPTASENFDRFFDDLGPSVRATRGRSPVRLFFQDQLPESQLSARRTPVV